MKKTNISLLLAVLFIIFNFALSAQNLEIHYINVQQGQSTLIIGPDGTTILYDGGNTGKGNSEVIPYLAGLGITTAQAIDYIILSHRDTDHYKGLTEVMDYGYDALNVYDNGSDKISTTIQDFLDAAAVTTSGGVTAMSTGQAISLGSGASATCVAVDGSVIGVGAISGGQNDENDRSVCLLIQYGDFDFLLTGDVGGGDDDNSCTGRSTTQVNIETPMVQAIMPGGASPLLSSYGVEIAHVAHHGSESSCNSDYMNQLTPTIGCISVGNNSYNHPRIDVVENVLLAQVPCITAPAALVLQTEEGNAAGTYTSYAGYCVGDIVITTDGIQSYTVSASGVVSQGPDERTAAGLPITYDLDEFSPSITVTAPNGGENWTYGSSQNITWTSLGVSGNVKISLWQNGSVVGTIAVGLSAASGSYTWTVGQLTTGTAPGGTGYTVKIKEIGTTVADTSDASFAIPKLTVTSPNGDENWTLGTIQNITWNSAAVSGNLKLTLWQGGALVGTIASGVAPGSGSYPWTVGQHSGGTAPAGTGYTIKIKEKGTTVVDTSDAPFSLSPGGASITVTSPNGGENWAHGSTQNITWTCSGVSGNVKITVLQAGVTVGTIASSVAPGTRTYPWIVSSPAGTGYTIKIKERGTAVADTGNSTFNITGITVTSPNGGESWTRSATQDITWTACSVGNVKITLLQGGVLVGTIASSVASSAGSYSWTVGQHSGGIAPAGAGYSIKIKEKGTTVSDTSDSGFTLL